MKIERHLKSKLVTKAPFTTSSKPTSSTFKSSSFKRDDAPKVAFKDGSKSRDKYKEKSKTKKVMVQKQMGKLFQR